MQKNAQMSPDINYKLNEEELKDIDESVLATRSAQLLKEVFKLDKPCNVSLLKWYKNLDKDERQFLSPFQARAKWLLFKEKWILNDEKEPDHDKI